MNTNTNTNTITISLSGGAQREAILAGLPAQSRQDYEVPADLLPRVLALSWSRIDRMGNVTCFVTDDCAARPADAVAAVEHGEHAARIQQTADAAAAAEKQRVDEGVRAACAAWAALPLNERARSTGRPWRVGDYEPAAVREAEDVLLAERIIAADREKLEREAARAEEEREVSAWVETHGSERLRLAVDLKQDCDGIYQSERLEIEHSGAYWDSNKFEDSDVINPSLEALRMLASVRDRCADSNILKHRVKREDWDDDHSPWFEVVCFDPGEWSKKRAVIRIR